MNNVNDLIEADLPKLHSIQVDPDVQEDRYAAMEVITPEGQHITAMCNELDFVVSKDKCSRLIHDVTLCKIVNRIYDFGVLLNSGKAPDQDRFMGRINTKLRENDMGFKSAPFESGYGYFDWKKGYFILIYHMTTMKFKAECDGYSLDEDLHGIMMTVPSYITSKQADSLRKLAEEYEKIFPEDMEHMAGRLCISGNNPINHIYDENDYREFSSISDLIEFLEQNGRIVDYELPLSEHSFEYDIPLTNRNR